MLGLQLVLVSLHNRFIIHIARRIESMTLNAMFRVVTCVVNQYT